MERPVTGRSRPGTAASRPGTAASRQAWQDHGPGGLYDAGDPESASKAPAVYGGFGADESPVAMESEVFNKDGSVRVQQRHQQQMVEEPKGCWHGFKRGIRSIWMTKQTEDTKYDRELYIKTTLRELIVYCIFLIDLCILTFGMTSPTMYYYTKVMENLFLDGGGPQNFRSIAQMGDVWQYLQGPLMQGLYWETWYNNWTVPQDALGYIYYENKLLGLPRVRMLRVKSNSCTVPKIFQNDIKDCYDTYAQGVEDRSVFGKQSNESAWNYRSESSLDGSSYWGQISTYAGGGFVQDLALTNAEASAQIAELMQYRWIDRATRATFIDFTVYNANINLFCVVKLVLEFPATGGVIPSWTFRTVKLIRYVTNFDYFVLACEGLFCVFIAYYLIEEAIEIKKHRCSYFKGFWNCLDVIVILIGVCSIIFSLYRVLMVDKKLNQLLANEYQYANFDFLSFAQNMYNNAVAIMVFFAWIKIFKYISFNKTMGQLSSTLSRCAKDIAGFAIMFFIFFFAYAQLGYLIFGTQIQDFSTFYDSTFTLLRTILGDFDFHALEQANRVLGPIFFITYVFFVFFILLNMFLAIINDTYAEVKAELATQRNEFELGDYFKRGYMNMLRKLNIKKDRIVDIQQALGGSDMNSDKQVDFDEWRQQLKQRGYAEQEIESMFAKYDMDGDRKLGEEEQRQMHASLDTQKDDLDKEMQRPGTARSDFNDFNDDAAFLTADASRNRRGRGVGGASYEEFNGLNRRVDRMEHSIGAIVSKIDAVLVKLEAMEKIKQRHQEEMEKIMNQINDSDLPEEQKRQQMSDLMSEEMNRYGNDTGSRPPSGKNAKHV